MEQRRKSVGCLVTNKDLKSQREWVEKIYPNAIMIAAYDGDIKDDGLKVAHMMATITTCEVIAFHDGWEDDEGNVAAWWMVRALGKEAIYESEVDQMFYDKTELDGFNFVHAVKCWWDDALRDERDEKDERDKVCVLFCGSECMSDEEFDARYDIMHSMGFQRVMAFYKANVEEACKILADEQPDAVYFCEDYPYTDEVQEFIGNCDEFDDGFPMYTEEGFVRNDEIPDCDDERDTCLDEKDEQIIQRVIADRDTVLRVHGMLDALTKVADEDVRDALCDAMDELEDVIWGTL